MRSIHEAVERLSSLLDALLGEVPHFVGNLVTAGGHRLSLLKTDRGRTAATPRRDETACVLGNSARESAQTSIGRAPVNLGAQTFGMAASTVWTRFGGLCI
ncbi:hypothetical protein GCM10008171_18900 [Methylopila jiangsuensis]|uniref:Uncharacterized protein n=1 Tax=Methylopila jiangsuensis TaxID=586230 RepID=A0A9W6JFH8_9HYPH|nr:hypothetical protein GCM10008171_18900 [Methylopila jiangsuensis]